MPLSLGQVHHTTNTLFLAIETVAILASGAPPFSCQHVTSNTGGRRPGSQCSAIVRPGGRHLTADMGLRLKAPPSARSCVFPAFRPPARLHPLRLKMGWQAWIFRQDHWGEVSSLLLPWSASRGQARQESSEPSIALYENCVLTCQCRRIKLGRETTLRQVSQAGLSS
ncbi:hypothetical protein LZ30DRAFT_210062 [Colletotrichum cereale]|nr:hypothetical protein LZ30DRAFT_210062 [Colletotrichum cereale]